MRRLQLEIAKKTPLTVKIPDEISVGEDGEPHEEDRRGGRQVPDEERRHRRRFPR